MTSLPFTVLVHTLNHRVRTFPTNPAFPSSRPDVRTSLVLCRSKLSTRAFARALAKRPPYAHNCPSTAHAVNAYALFAELALRRSRDATARPP